ncbi:MAG: hypothetical protein ACRC33_15490 [Gemmataceae bacterium]
MASVEKLKQDLYPELAETFSPFRTAGGKPQLLRPEQRLSYGIAKHGVEYRVMLLVEKEGGWAHNQALALQKDRPGEIDVQVLGAAQSGKPGPVSPAVQAKRSPGVREWVLRPGLSVSHFEGLPGTLGCLVNLKDTDGTVVPGLVSASHVLGNMNSAEEGDRVVHPGNVDTDPTVEEVVGPLWNYQLLRHHSDATLAQALGNRLDVGAAEIRDHHRVSENLVPSPADPDGTTIRLRGVVPLDEMTDLIDQEVYKVGRTTWFTRGVLRYALVTQQSVTMTDNRVYHFRDVAVVHSSVPNQPFSEPGDSGSVVYTADGRGVGLVIGGTARYTLLSPLEPSLKQMKAELYV